MTQNIIKIIICNVASSYQVNLAIEIRNITENYINLHVSLVDIGYLQCLFKYTSYCWETGPRSAVGNVSGYRCESDCNPGVASSIPAGPILSWRLIMK